MDAADADDLEGAQLCWFPKSRLKDHSSQPCSGEARAAAQCSALPCLVGQGDGDPCNDDTEDVDETAKRDLVFDVFAPHSSAVGASPGGISSSAVVFDMASEDITALDDSIAETASYSNKQDQDDHSTVLPSPALPRPRWHDVIDTDEDVAGLTDLDFGCAATVSTELPTRCAASKVHSLDANVEEVSSIGHAGTNSQEQQTRCEPSAVDSPGVLALTADTADGLVPSLPVLPFTPPDEGEAGSVRRSEARPPCLVNAGGGSGLDGATAAADVAAAPCSALPCLVGQGDGGPCNQPDAKDRSMGIAASQEARTPGGPLPPATSPQGTRSPGTCPGGGTQTSAEDLHDGDAELPLGDSICDDDGLMQDFALSTSTDFYHVAKQLLPEVYGLGDDCEDDPHVDGFVGDEELLDNDLFLARYPAPATFHGTQHLAPVAQAAGQQTRDVHVQQAPHAQRGPLPQRDSPTPRDVTLTSDLALAVVKELEEAKDFHDLTVDDSSSGAFTSLDTLVGLERITDQMDPSPIKDALAALVLAHRPIVEAWHAGNPGYATQEAAERAQQAPQAKGTQDGLDICHASLSLMTQSLEGSQFSQSLDCSPRPLHELIEDRPWQQL